MTPIKALDRIIDGVSEMRGCVYKLTSRVYHGDTVPPRHGSTLSVCIAQEGGALHGAGDDFIKTEDDIQRLIGKIRKRSIDPYHEATIKPLGSLKVATPRHASKAPLCAMDVARLVIEQVGLDFDDIIVSVNITETHIGGWHTKLEIVFKGRFTQQMTFGPALCGDDVTAIVNRMLNHREVIDRQRSENTGEVR